MTISPADRQRLIALFPFIHGVARTVTRGNRELAEDIAQEVCCKFLTATHQYQDQGQLKAYLARAVRNQYADFCRRSSTRCELYYDPDAAELVTPALGNQHSRLELLDTLDALDRIPQPQALAVLAFALGENETDYATRVGIPHGTVKSRVNRGRAALRQLG